MTKPKQECSTGKRRFRNSDLAYQRLDQVLDNPDLYQNRLYQPNGVVWCPNCKGFHLTSKVTKRWGKGKVSRDYQVRRRN
jgi:hypothetical protein